MTGTHIIAVDPGGVTGIAEWSLDLSLCQLYEVPGGYSGLVEDWSWEGVKAVVCESFTVTPQTLKNTRQQDAQDIIGWLKGECLLRRVPLVFQAPSKKKFGSRRKLKALQMFRSSPGGHMEAAAAHLLVYLVETEKDPEALRLLQEFVRAQDQS